ncbi:hypothetical protein [Spirillospora sp. CA-128828]|uniref:hypothetical protein n=1 Tax=Spirillospora sp. CA-128828 TaxID=3240033 RepID=UPI003D93C6B9
MAGETGKATVVTGPMESTAGDGGRSARLNHAMGARRLHLAALDAVIGRSEEPLSCGLVSREGGPPVLLVVSGADRARSVHVGCERVGGVWWFVRADSGEGIVPVDEVESAPAVLAGMVAGGKAGTR